MRFAEHVRAAVEHDYDRARRCILRAHPYDFARSRESEIESWTQHYLEGAALDPAGEALLDAAARAHAHFREWPSTRSLDRAVTA